MYVVDKAKRHIIDALDAFEDASITRSALKEEIEHALGCLYDTAFECGIDSCSVGEDDDEIVFEAEVDLDDLREKPHPDEDGHCSRCGLPWPDERETLEPHECPPGFLRRTE